MKWLALVLMLVAGSALAIEPDEVLDDPVLEERAREISQGLRCPVCQNESIDESAMPVARDLRLLVRERLLAGDSNDEALNFIVARYGEFVLLKPQTGGANLVLWLSGPLVFLLVLGAFILARRTKGSEDALTAEEEARLAQLLADDAPK
ncbi:MAG: cytochrome c-type biogenesis protein [Pseudomonadota bacterium]